MEEHEGSADPEPAPWGADGTEGEREYEFGASEEPLPGRYEVRGEVGRGAMGVVYRVRDEDLDRDLAMKVLIEKSLADGDGLDSSDRRKLARFLEEAKITGQLDHPGIVPVHELGMDELGRNYFTMRLVQGRDLKSLIDLVHAGDEEWTMTRAVGIVLRVCEAVAFAHERGIVHRDIKPSNVMVGSLGETYVMDWGLAKDLRREDPHDIRLRTEEPHADEGEPGDSLTTMDGHIVGTPAYMAPEQARGAVEEVGPAADVYSLGALLYHVLAGSGPYVQPDAPGVQLLVLEAVRRRPPDPIEQRAPDAPPQLQAICAKAMQREPTERYRDVSAMADDLRAYLEGRVVKAYESGAVAELRSWVRRNRALAASVAAALLAVIAGLAAVGIVQSRERAKAELAKEQADRARDEADLQRDKADALATRNQRFADGAHAQSLVVREAELWPVHADTLPAMDAWLAEAGDVLEGLAELRDELAGLRARALPYSEAERARDWGWVRDERAAELVESQRLASGLPPLRAYLQAERSAKGRGHADVLALEGELEDGVKRLRELEESFETRRTYSFADVADLRAHATLSGIVRALDRLALYVARVRERRTLAAVIEERSLTGENARRRWDEAIADVALRSGYDGLVLRPVHGLLPLEPDPVTGLWEFAHLASGEPPARDPRNNRYTVTAQTGIVLVLVPGGSFRMGCSEDECRPDELPTIDVSLDPFFMAKYELTRAQWERVAHEDPSFLIEVPEPKRCPVERVSWVQAVEVFESYGLVLPTEAQWEYACRAGSSGSYCFGDDPALLERYGNVADETMLRALGSAPQDAAQWWDGHVWTAPVGSFEPNAFGLHDLHGNVREYCADDFVELESPRRSRTGDGGVENLPDFVRVVHRGGSWQYPPGSSRCADRRHGEKYSYRHSAGADVGVRPALTIP